MLAPILNVSMRTPTTAAPAAGVLLECSAAPLHVDAAPRKIVAKLARIKLTQDMRRVSREVLQILPTARNFPPSSMNDFPDMEDLPATDPADGVLSTPRGEVSGFRSGAARALFPVSSIQPHTRYGYE
jgi:hypothetical protein